MKSQVSGIIAYGAAAEPEPRLGPLTKARHQARYAYHTTRDRLRWRSGDLSRVDYRNYQDETTLNRGDQAIVDAVLQKMCTRDSTLKFCRTNWGNLGGIPISTAMVAVCGGGYIFMDRNAQLPERIKKDIEMFGRVAAPVVLVGVGINQLLEPGQRHASRMAEPTSETLRKLLSRADLISVRDRATQSTLEKLTDKPVHMVGDPALYFAPPQSHGRGQGGRLHIGINFPFHGKTPNEHIQRDLAKYVELLKKMQREYSCKFYYMVHYSTELLIARLLKDAGISLQVVSGSPAQLVKGYGELDVHLGGMLHSCILATTAGTPCVGLAYDMKHSGFFDTMDQAEHCISVVDLDIDQVLETIRVVIGSQHAIRQKSLNRRLQLEGDFDRFLDAALKLLPEPAQDLRQ